MPSAIFPHSKPVLAFTCGDPAGIGAAAVLGALRSGNLRRRCVPLLVGERRVWKRAGWRPGLAQILSPGLPAASLPPYGRASAAGGASSFSALRLALRLAVRGLVSGIVTAPISKEAWDLAGIPYRDHTEFFREKTKADVQMALGIPRLKLWCLTATRHVPLRKVPRALKAVSLAQAARALKRALGLLGLARPRLGLCALNPHAGEEGLLGAEEGRILAPAVLSARRSGVDITGPIAADTAWRWHREGKLDGLVCLYHDQALIPLKVAAGLEAVNWTLGLPFVRTSPGHGTGFDIAGRSRPDCRATMAAAELAAFLCRV